MSLAGEDFLRSNVIDVVEIEIQVDASVIHMPKRNPNRQNSLNH